LFCYSNASLPSNACASNAMPTHPVGLPNGNFLFKQYKRLIGPYNFIVAWMFPLLEAWFKLWDHDLEVTVPYEAKIDDKTVITATYKGFEPKQARGTRRRTWTRMLKLKLSCSAEHSSTVMPTRTLQSFFVQGMLPEPNHLPLTSRRASPFYALRTCKRLMCLCTMMHADHKDERIIRPNSICNAYWRLMNSGKLMDVVHQVWKKKDAPNLVVAQGNADLAARQRARELGFHLPTARDAALLAARMRAGAGRKRMTEVRCWPLACMVLPCSGHT
jgi:hypothetical protein